MSTIHDVLRYVIRNQGHRDKATEQDLLLAVDADQQGFPDLESYKAELERQAKEAAAANSAAGQAMQQAADRAGVINDASDADLEAELARRQAARQLQQSGNQTLRPAPPAFGR